MTMFSAYNKYDLVLLGIGVIIALMLTSSLISVTATALVGVVGAALVGHALFIMPPTDNDGPKDLSTRSTYR